MYGVVNNARYLHYLEHCRHQWLNSLGKSPTVFLEEGMIWTIRQVNITYKTPLRSGDEITIDACMKEITGVTLSIEQTIQNTHTNQLHAQAMVVALLLNQDHKPMRIPATIRNLFGG